MSEINKKQNFQKKFSESAKLHPPTLEFTSPSNINPETSPKEPIKKIKSKHTKYIGVNWCTHANKWHATLKIGNKKFSMGRHMTDEAAALAYDQYVRKLAKRLSRYNFPDGNDNIAVAESDRAIAEIHDKKVPQDNEFFGPLTLLDKVDSRDKT